MDPGPDRQTAAPAEVAELSSPVGETPALAGAVAVGLVPVVRGWFSSPVVQDWTRARSTSEALKSEVFMYLAGTGRCRDADRDDRFPETDAKGT